MAFLAALAFESGGDLVGWCGAVEMKALGLVAVHGFEDCELLACFDAFGEGFVAEGVCEQDDIGDEGAGFGLFGDAGDEGLVDLDGVDG